MDKSRISMTRRGLSWTAAVVAGSALLASGAGLAQDVHQHATPAAHDHVAHAAHNHDAVPEVKPGEYQRSVQTYSVPDVTLVDSNGKPVRLREPAGRQRAGDDEFHLHDLHGDLPGDDQHLLRRCRRSWEPAPTSCA